MIIKSRSIGISRNMAYHGINAMIFQEPGPGTGNPDRITLNIDRTSHKGRIEDFCMVFIQVMYVDLISPNFNTVTKLLSLSDIAKEYAVDAGTRKMKESKSAFSKIATRLRKAAKILEDQFYFENSTNQQKIYLYDLILYFLKDHKISFEGLLPTM